MEKINKQKISREIDDKLLKKIYIINSAFPPSSPLSLTLSNLTPCVCSQREAALASLCVPDNKIVHSTGGFNDM